MSEYHLQVAVIKHLQSAFPHLLYFHIPNQSRDATEAFFNKQLGVRPGASDLLIAWKGGQGFIELKMDKGRVSNEQNKFLSAFRHIGWHTSVCRSVRQVHDSLCTWGLKPGHNTCIEPDHATKEEKFQRVFDAFKP